MAIYQSIYTCAEIDEGIGKAGTALQANGFEDKTTSGISQTSGFNDFRFLGLNGNTKYKFDRSVINEMARQSAANHFNSNINNIVRPGIYYGGLTTRPNIFSDAGTSKYTHVLVSGTNDVFQIAFANGTRTIGVRNGDQNGYSRGLVPLRSPLFINAASGATLTTYVNNLYRFDGAVTSLAVTLPNTSLEYADKIELVFTTGTGASVSFTEPNSNPIVYQTGYQIEDGKTYKITAEWLGNKWLISYITIS